MTDLFLDPLRWETVEAGDSAVLTAWLASEGDRVRAGQPLARLHLVGETIELPAPHAGVLEQVCVPAGERVAPGHVLARLVAF